MPLPGPWNEILSAKLFTNPGVFTMQIMFPKINKHKRAHWQKVKSVGMEQKNKCAKMPEQVLLFFTE